MGRNGGLTWAFAPRPFGGVLLASHAYKVLRILSMLAGSSGSRINAMDGAAVDWNR